jgi:2-oxoisovalerate dehydrogenase E2 component (dihydrolipoyl transacylase)
MGIHVIKMPDIGEGIAEVELVEWHVRVGEAVAEDQTLADVMTDKASVEIPSPVAGKVLALGGKPGDVLAVGAELIRIETEGEGNVPAGSAASGTAPAAASPTEAPKAVSPTGAAKAEAVAGARRDVAAAATPREARSKPHIPARGAFDVSRRAHADADAKAGPALAAPATGTPARAATDKPLASPSVRRHASEFGVELEHVSGTGPGGRITHEDVEAAAARSGQRAASAAEPISGAAQQSPPAARYAERNDEESIPVIGLRRKIAQKMQESKRRIPHFTYVEEVDVTELEALRAKLNAQWAAARGKLTLLPFLMRAMVRALPNFPEINARYDDDNATLTRYGAVHIGIATQTDGGLVVPVVRHAEARDLWSSAAELARLAGAARSGKATRDELGGSTITITSLGPLGGIVTTPVINHPEVAIVGVNRIVERPVIRNGAIVPRLMMNLSSSFDHRVVDGMRGAEFVQALRGFLEHPATLFIE